MLYGWDEKSWQAYAVSANILYGHGVFETLHVRNNQILFSAYHQERLYKACQSGGWTLPLVWSEVEGFIYDVCCHKGISNARVNVYVYPPESIPYVFIRISEWGLGNYPLHPPVRIGIYKEGQVVFTPWSAYKLTSRWLYRQAEVYAQRYQWADALILSTHNYVAESSRSNIFWVKEGVLYTPHLHTGCVGGVLRQQILMLAQNLGLTVVEGFFTVLDLLGAQEVFLTNVLRGIQPVWNIYGHPITFRTDTNIVTQALARALEAWHSIS